MLALIILFNLNHLLQFNGFKYCYQSLIVLFDFNPLFAHCLDISTIGISSQLICLTPPPSMFKIKQGVVLVCHKSNLKNTTGKTMYELRLDKTSRLIISSLYDCPYNRQNVTVECYESRDYFVCWVTRIQISNITVCHPQPTEGFFWSGGGLTLCRSTVGIFCIHSR